MVMPALKKAERMGLIHMENLEDYATIKFLIETHCINDREAFALVKDYALQQLDRGKRLLMFFKDAEAWIGYG